MKSNNGSRVNQIYAFIAITSRSNSFRHQWTVQTGVGVRFHTFLFNFPSALSAVQRSGPRSGPLLPTVFCNEPTVSHALYVFHVVENRDTTPFILFHKDYRGYGIWSSPSALFAAYVCCWCFSFLCSATWTHDLWLLIVERSIRTCTCTCFPAVLCSANSKYQHSPSTMVERPTVAVNIYRYMCICVYVWLC